MQLLSEIRIHSCALQSLFSDMTGFCQVCNYYLRFESTHALYAVAVFRHDGILSSMQLLSEISNPLMGSTAVAVFRHDEIMKLMQLLSEFRIHSCALLQ
ncbi:hypothetical protein CEXT_90841 [Caerostris extrusa]|uniref:Uncharacterized protein n=1 Tax=Caerostris extrusa TaxID=172846 RepID=A0AAV4S7G9_CAEEX|nr:hypothetical protein CEXT_90841 [Caerostris extrusa]